MLQSNYMNSQNSSTPAGVRFFSWHRYHQLNFNVTQYCEIKVSWISIWKGYHIENMWNEADTGIKFCINNFEQALKIQSRKTFSLTFLKHFCFNRPLEGNLQPFMRAAGMIWCLPPLCWDVNGVEKAVIKSVRRRGRIKITHWLGQCSLWVSDSRFMGLE